jgi:hypothetical protein
MKTIKFIIVVVVSLLINAGYVLAEEKADSSGVDVVTKATPKTAAIHDLVKKFIEDTICASGEICNTEGLFAYFEGMEGKVWKKEGGYVVAVAKFKMEEDIFMVDVYLKTVSKEKVVEKMVLKEKNGEPMDSLIWSKK